jgi:hypothetical protein
MTEREIKMTARFWQAAIKVQNERLPGWEAFLATDPKAKGYMNEKEERLLIAFRDDDDILFDQYIESWAKAWERINEVVAEKYRKENTDPEEWQLRYIKWMKITYIHFTSKKGDFYLLPRRPRKKPKATHWYTVDEMLDMLHPVTVAAMKLSDVMPMRPESVKGPAPGEKHLIVDCTGPEVTARYELPKRGRRG